MTTQERLMEYRQEIRKARESEDFDIQKKREEIQRDKEYLNELNDEIENVKVI